MDAAVRKVLTLKPFSLITPTASIARETHGERAKCLQRLVRLDLPVPTSIALSFETVRRIATGTLPDTRSIMDRLGDRTLVSVRPSSMDPNWGGPRAILNVGITRDSHVALTESLGETAANTLYLRFIQSYAANVARLNPDMFDLPPEPTQDALESALLAFREETGDDFPQDPAVQLGEVLRSVARAWEGTTSRLLRQAKGAAADAGLGLVVQKMALALGSVESGAGCVQFVNGSSGERSVEGCYLRQRQEYADQSGGFDTVSAAADPEGRSLDDLCPEILEQLVAHGQTCRDAFREEMRIEFTVESNRLNVLDAVSVMRSNRAALRIAVSLAEDGVIQPGDAVLRVDPRALTEQLHPQICPAAPRDVVAQGIPASPGAATGRIVFSSTAAQTGATGGLDCILVRRETAPEDIRGMHAACGVLTERGGQTSHAAVIARGIGLPCVVGSSEIRIHQHRKTLELADGRKLTEGDLITLDGATGEVLAGAVEMLGPDLDEAFHILMRWADDARDMEIRANADTPAEARVASRFAAQGIGLCRTEHMFYHDDRLTVMREMIFAGSPEGRHATLDRLLPMQRADFVELFEIMQGKPVCIRLFDPPLHEFLPSAREDQRALAESLDLPIAEVTARVEQLSEFNPMLGMRGVRLGVTVPEIYDMQARAIFEATITASHSGAPVVPEIMIPLVSARREVEIVKTRLDAVAAAVRVETGVKIDYRLGVMVETPRACLRAGEIAEQAEFLSFGTNDLTQMTYGLSRDDAGRFMSDYVSRGVYPEDPFHILDVDGVGELLVIGAKRGRDTSPEITLSVCGEHGGNVESIAFCRDAGFDYVSCSPYRVPIARLAAAHLALKSDV